MKKYDKTLFRVDMQQIDWESILGPIEGDPADMAATFLDVFESALNLHAPLRKKRVRCEYAPWLSASLRNLMKERDKAKQIADGQQEIWPKYRQLRNQVTKGIRIAIQDYYSGLIKEHEKDPKRMWKTINKVLDKNTNSDIPSSLEFEGKRLTREPDILEAFNHHFTSIGPKLAQKIEVRNDDDCLQNITTESNDMIFRNVDENYILDAINQLKNGKASGPGKVSITIVKDVKDLIVKLLKFIFNDSVISGVFPDIWKLARVTPIFKSGAKNDASIYRPISVISIFSRMLERLLHDQLFHSSKRIKSLPVINQLFKNYAPP